MFNPKMEIVVFKLGGVALGFLQLTMPMFRLLDVRFSKHPLDTVSGSYHVLAGLLG